MATEIHERVKQPGENSATAHQQKIEKQEIPPALAVIKAMIYEHHQKLAPLESKLKELM